MLAGLTEGLGVHYLISAACGFTDGTSPNYLLCSRWIFPGRSRGSPRLGCPLFFLTAAAGLVLNDLAIRVLTEFCAFHYLLAKVLAGSSIFTINFLIRKHILFR